MIPLVWGESYRTSSNGTTEPSASNISSKVEQMDKTSYGATHWLADLQLLLGQTRNSFPQDALVVLKNRRHKARKQVSISSLWQRLLKRKSCRPTHMVRYRRLSLLRPNRGWQANSATQDTFAFPFSQQRQVA